MKIEKIKIKNYKVFRDVEIRDLPNLCVFLGANGAGKSTLFDAFAFLKSALQNEVKTAVNERGGFQEVVSRESSGDIEFQIQFRKTSKTDDAPLFDYKISIGLNEEKHPIFTEERLNIFRGQTGKPFTLLLITRGKGVAQGNEVDGETHDLWGDVPISNRGETAAIKGLSQFRRFQDIGVAYHLLSNTSLFDFHIQSAQHFEGKNASQSLSPNGNNLAQVAKYLFENHRPIFDKILQKMTRRVPGLSQVEAKETIDGRVVLQFHDGSFRDPFAASQVSDGTLKMFAFLLLLNDPAPHPLLCVEEPENYLHPELLAELAEEFREYAQRGGQVFISTHSPDFVNFLNVDELFWLHKKDGYTTIQRAKDDPIVQKLVNEGDLLGSLWKQEYLRGSGPKS